MYALFSSMSRSAELEMKTIDHIEMGKCWLLDVCLIVEDIGPDQADVVRVVLYQQLVLLNKVRKFAYVVCDDIVEPSYLLFLSGVLLQDVVDGPERKLRGSVGRHVPQLVRLLRPMLLLYRVVNVADSLRPGVGEAVGEVLVLPELVLELGVDLAPEPGLVLARVWVVGAHLISVVNVLLFIIRSWCKPRQDVANVQFSCTWL